MLKLIENPLFIKKREDVKSDLHVIPGPNTLPNRKDYSEMEKFRAEIQKARDETLDNTIMDMWRNI